MGLSFHDESSMVEASIIGSLRFAPDIPEPITENGIVDEDFDIQLSDDSDIQMVDRWIVERTCIQKQ